MFQAIHLSIDTVFLNKNLRSEFPACSNPLHFKVALGYHAKPIVFENFWQDFISGSIFKELDY